MMQQDHTGPAQEAKELEATIFNLKESIAGVEGLMDKPLVKIEQGIVAMDQGFRSLVNSMGAGENMSEAIRKNLAGATIETIKMGGDAKSALNVQLDTLKVMGKNVTLSQNLTTELFAASQVSGKSIEELENGFLNAGMSLKDISKQMLVVRDVANSLGVNAKLVSDSVVKNLDKLNSYGFQGGVEGLARMAAKATALRVDMQSTFNVADKLMSPEGAIEMSAALQRLGATSTDLLDPLKLMDLAQNNVPELQKQLGDMFKQYTFFDEKTKSFQIMPGARRQLKEIAGELGMGIEEVQRMALGTADLDKKLSEISFSGFEVSEDTKEMVANMATMTDSGEYKIQTEEIGADGKPVSKTIQEVMEQFKGDEAGLKEYLTGLDKSKQPKTIEEIAQEQLDVLTGIRKASEALVASPGLAAGASKVGPQVLQSAKALAENINEPLIKKLGPDSEGLMRTFDNTAVKLEKAFENLTSPEKEKKEEGGRQLLEAIGTLSKGMGGQIAEGVGDSLTGFSKLFGVDIDEYKKSIEDAFLTAEEKAAKLKEKLKGEKSEEDKTIFPDDNKLIFPDSVNTQEIKTSSITVEKPETEEETKLIFPDNVESKEIKTGKIIVEEGINLTVPTPTPTITPTNVTPEVENKPTGEVKGETIINPVEDPQLQANFKKLQELVAKGLVGEPLAGTGNEVLFNQELPEVQIGEPQVETKGGFLEKIMSIGKTIEPEEPSAYEGYKKLLEEISSAKIVGEGKEAFFLTPEMIEEGKKGSELIGPENNTFDNVETKKLEKPSKKLFDFKPSILGKYISEQNETPIEDLEKIEPKGLIEDEGLAPVKPTLASLPIPEKEEKKPLGERLKEGFGQLKEKFKGKQEEEKPVATVPETTKVFVARDAEGNIVGKSIDKETARKKSKGMAVTVEEETQTVTPTVPETPAVGVEKAAAEDKEKVSFKDRLKKLLEERPDESEAKITIEEPKEVKPTEETQKEESGYLKMLDENDKEADKFLTGKKTSPFGLDMSMFSQKLPTPPKASLEVEETKPVASNIENIFEDEEDFGPIEPVSEFAEDGTIKPFSGKSEEIKEPEETEIQKTIREAREKQLAFLEELRLKEQAPETPARGIERFAEIGEKFGGKIGGIGKKLFGKETSQLGEYVAENDYDQSDEYNVADIPTQETPIPEPINTEQGGYGEAGGEIKPEETGENVMTVEGGSPIVIEVKHTFNGLPSTIDTAQLTKIFETNYPLQQAMSTAVKRAATELGLTK